VSLSKLDASEAGALLRRLGVRTVPMVLFMYEGRLVDAGNDICSRAELVDRALAALAAGRRGDGRPPDSAAIAAGGARCATGRLQALFPSWPPSSGCWRADQRHWLRLPWG
jgi:thioredoxin-like negative regulator of GroEL